MIHSTQYLSSRRECTWDLRHWSDGGRFMYGAGRGCGRAGKTDKARPAQNAQGGLSSLDSKRQHLEAWAPPGRTSLYTHPLKNLLINNVA